MYTSRWTQVKSSGIRQSKITKGAVLAGLGGKGLRKRDGQIDPVNPSPPTGLGRKGLIQTHTYLRQTLLQGFTV